MVLICVMELGMIVVFKEQLLQQATMDVHF